MGPVHRGAEPGGPASLWTPHACSATHPVLLTPQPPEEPGNKPPEAEDLLGVERTPSGRVRRTSAQVAVFHLQEIAEDELARDWTKRQMKDDLVPETARVSCLQRDRLQGGVLGSLLTSDRCGCMGSALAPPPGLILMPACLGSSTTPGLASPHSTPSCWRRGRMRSRRRAMSTAPMM